MDKTKSVGIIGYGNMGQAIAERIKDKYLVNVFDKDKNKISSLNNASTDIESLVKKSEVIILSIKPQDFDALLAEIKPFSENKFFITIAAGITTKFMKSRLGDNTRVVRVMPNMPAQIGQGVTVIFKGEESLGDGSTQAWQLAYDIFSNLGSVLAVDKEDMINMATAISGSGPAFFCQYMKERKNAPAMRDEFIKMLTDSAVGLGFDRKEAEFLSERAVDGIISMLIEKNLSCADVIKIVASKGGTTQAGLDVLSSGGTLEEAVKSAYKRAGELGQGS